MSFAVQSHGRWLGPEARQRQEGAEQPNPSDPGGVGEGGVRSSLLIELINQARSEQDPTLSTLRQGCAIHAEAGASASQPRQQCHHPLLSSLSQWKHPARPGHVLLQRWLPTSFPFPSDSKSHILGPSGSAALGYEEFWERHRALTHWFLAGCWQGRAPGDAQGYHQGPYVLSISR